MGVNYYFIFDSQSYNMEAAFKLSTRQIRNGGSFIVIPFFNHLEVNLGTKFVPGSAPGLPTEVPQFGNGTFDSVGVAGGYGYMWVWNRISASLQGSVGPAVQRVLVQRPQTPDINKVSYGFKINGSTSLVWNGDVQSYGLQILVDSIATQAVGATMYSTLINGMVFGAFRF